jgi:hypothetical protein
MNATAHQFASKVKEMERHGQDIYPVDHVTSFPIASTACRGRVPPIGSTFTGHIDLTTQKMRMDCADALEFWMELDLAKIPLFANLFDVSTPLAETDFFRAVQHARPGKKAEEKA